MPDQTITSVSREHRLFRPSAEFKAQANLGSEAAYKRLYDESVNSPEKFWGRQAKEQLVWRKPFKKVLDWKPPHAKWFVGGRTNLCHNAVDRHLATRPDQAALVYLSTETGQESRYTYRELHAEVNRFAAVLKGLGVGHGDRVLVYMPMIPEAVFAMLACARIGAIHSVVFGGFASVSLASRIDDAEPTVIVSADAGSRGGKVVAYKPLLDEAISLAAHKPARVLMVTAAISACRAPDSMAALARFKDCMANASICWRVMPRALAVSWANEPIARPV